MTGFELQTCCFRSDQYANPDPQSLKIRFIVDGPSHPFLSDANYAHARLSRLKARDNRMPKNEIHYLLPTTYCCYLLKVNYLSGYRLQ